MSIKVLKLCPRMIGQTKISSFFSTSQKRQSSVDQNTPPKKTKLSGEGSPNGTISPPAPTSKEISPSLSPEQKQKVVENRSKALAKLHEKQSNGLLAGVGQSWWNALEPEFTKPYFVKLSEFVQCERRKHTVYPTPENVFSWTRACDISDVKVIILGQDPYHGPNQAHGLSFSVLPGVPPPPSLVNMYKELVTDIEGFKHPGHGYLQGWAKQGVLMLNACLTVRAHQANSHKDQGWEKFTDAVVSWFNQHQHDIVFILWGAYAQKKGARIDQKKHRVIKGVHPSPLSAHKGFMGSKPYSQCNTFLQENGKQPIDWSHLPVE